MTQSEIFEYIGILKDNLCDTYGGSHYVYDIPGVDNIIENCIKEILDMGWEEEDGEIVKWEEFDANVLMLAEEKLGLDEMENYDE